MHRIAWLPFQSARDAIANIARVEGANFLARKDEGAVSCPAKRACVIVVEPVLGVIGMARRVEVRVAFIQPSVPLSFWSM